MRLTAALEEDRLIAHAERPGAASADLFDPADSPDPIDLTALAAAIESADNRRDG